MTRRDYNLNLMIHDIKASDQMIRKRQRTVRELNKVKDASLRRMKLMRTEAMKDEGRQAQNSNVLSISWAPGVNFTSYSDSPTRLPKRLIDIITYDLRVKRWRAEHKKDWLQELYTRDIEHLERAEISLFRKKQKARLCIGQSRRPTPIKDALFYLNKAFDESEYKATKPTYLDHDRMNIKAEDGSAGPAKGA